MVIQAPKKIKKMREKIIARGKLVVVEGTSGAGKTTAIVGLRECGIFDDWYLTREPGGTKFGDRMRQAVQGPELTKVHPLAALMAYAASRANSVNFEIKPRLEKGINCLSDRWWFSTWAYQGAEGVSKLTIWLINMIAIRGQQPDLTLFYDVPAKIGLKRKTLCPDIDRYDLKRSEFMERARRNYLQLGRFYPRSWVTIDTVDKNSNEVVDETIRILGRRGLI